MTLLYARAVSAFVMCCNLFADVPSFVSNDYIVLFDPHTKYVPGVNAAQPGMS